MGLLREKIRYTEFHLPLSVNSLLYKTVFRSENPFNSEFEKTKTIFIHIPKNAGTSIAKTVYGQSLGHIPISRYKSYNKEKYQTYFKFAVIRNPWDRLYSAYKYLKAREGKPQWLDGQFADKYLRGLDTFEAFVLKLSERSYRNSVLTFKHLIPQHYWITFPSSRDTVQMDYIVRFEALEEDLKKALRLEGLDLDEDLLHERKTKKKNYTEVYSSQMKEIVADIYPKDIQLFDYSFK
jgi:hypothetical protein